METKTAYHSYRLASHPNDQLVTVIGAGIAGCISALHLAEKGYHVLLLERRATILSGTADNWMHRAGLGMHALTDMKTAEAYLRWTIAFCRANPEVLETDPIAKEGYYVFMDKALGSNLTKEQIQEGFTFLKHAYEALIKEDPRNQIFGEPEAFYQVLSEKEYAKYVGETFLPHVIHAVKAPEVIIDWPRLQATLQEKIAQHPRIQVITNIAAEKLQPCGQGYEIHAKENEGEHKTKVFRSAAVVNAAWDGAEALNQSLHKTEGNVKQRLKLSLKLNLNGASKLIPSTMFLQGAFAAFVNEGNGKGTLTVADITNIGLHDKSKPAVTDEMFVAFMEAKKKKQIEASFESWLYEEMPEDIKKSLEEALWQQVQDYLPDLASASIAGLQMGIVKTPGENMNIHDPKSDIHKRSDNGVINHGDGYIQNDARKFMAAEANATEVDGYVDKFFDRKPDARGSFAEKYTNAVPHAARQWVSAVVEKASSNVSLKENGRRLGHPSGLEL